MFNKKDLLAFCAPLLGILGIKEFHDEAGRKALTQEEKAKLASFGFTDQFMKDFEEALNDKDGKKKEDPTTAMAAVSAMLAQVTNDLTKANEQLAALKASEKTAKDDLAKKEAQVVELTSRVKTLSDIAESDPGKDAGATGDKAQGIDLSNADQLGGRQGEMFALDRPYNLRAKAALMSSLEGKQLVGVAAAKPMDYSRLKDDLGAFYRQPWKDRVQSILMLLPTVETLWPLESGYQDLATLVNIWLGEFSQADNTIDSDFDKVAKGSYEWGHETLRMFSVMFSHKFRNLKEIETLWIGSLNKEGSKVIKWSLIEFLLVETAKKLHNEREQRRINGVRKNPTPNVPGTAMAAADGIYEFIRKKIDGHIDYTPDGGTTGKTVYQIKPFELPAITEENIGEVIYTGTSMVPSTFRDTGNLVLYMPSHLVPWYHKYNEVRYGMNQDYRPNEMVVHEFPAVRIKPVPNADNHFRLIWTIDGNIKCYEQAAGEMLDFQIEQQDWSLKVWSNWKESIWAEAVGYKYTDKLEMDGSRQFIWTNSEDRPASYFLPGERDKQPSALLHTSIQTVANSAVLQIADIQDAPVGVAVAIKCGEGGDAGVEIKKEGNFSLISEAWKPSKGDVIRLMKRADGKFIELGRGAAEQTSLMFAANATTPSVKGASVFMTGDNTAATAITKLQDAVPGKVYTIHGNGSANASTIANGGNFSLTGAMTLKEGAWIKLVADENGKMHEIARG